MEQLGSIVRQYTQLQTIRKNGGMQLDLRRLEAMREDGLQMHASSRVSLEKEAMKSCKEAVSLKEKGNACFKAKRYGESLKLYTQAILKAPWPISAQQKRAKDIQTAATKYSETFPPIQIGSGDATMETILAILYGNNSAVLFELGSYQECLENIKMALKLGVNSSIEQKLLKRQQNCLAAMKSKKSRFSKDPKKQNKELMSCSVLKSKFVCVQSCIESGRLVEATKTVKAGKVLATEWPFAFLLDSHFKLTHCSYCFSNISFIIPCCWCTTEGYCSEECMENAWGKYHWAECERAYLLQDRALGPDSRTCLRILAQVSSEDYEAIFSLITHKEDVVKDSPLAKQYEGMALQLEASFGDVFKDSVDCSSLSLKERFLHHLMQLRCNTVGVSSLCSSFEQPPNNSGAEHDNYVTEVCEARLGRALYTTLSLVNHSCQPNAILRFEGNKASLCATKPIKAGEEVTITYGPQAGRSPREERQAELKGTFFFDCTCIACKDTSYEVQNSLRCMKCSGPLIACHNDTSLISCAQCKHTPSNTQLVHQNEKAKRAKEMLDRAVRQEPYDLPLLLKCYELQSQVLYKDNLTLALTNDTLAQVYALQGDHTKSAHYCAASCRALGVAYGENAVEVGNELFKLAPLYFYSCNWSQALKTALKARDILGIYLGPYHERCQELDEMIKTLQN